LVTGLHAWVAQMVRMRGLLLLMLLLLLVFIVITVP
jgi:hypothetical protein